MNPFTRVINGVVVSYTEEQAETCLLVEKLYKDERGEPITLAPGQCDIFDCIYIQPWDRVHVDCFTRYGKSLTIGLAVLTRAAHIPEKTAIISKSKDKASIIMSVVNAHIFDNDFTRARFIAPKGMSDDDLKRFRNKTRVTFDLGDGKQSEIFSGTAKEALGFGARNVIEDEASLINDFDHSMVMRMLGDDPLNNFLCKIGNPFFRNHFYDSEQDPAYHHIKIDCYQGLREGRITQERIDEARQFAYFGILFECNFPAADAQDEQGWIPLLTEDEIRLVMGEGVHAGEQRLGNDVADTGANHSVTVKRSSTYAEIIFDSPDVDAVQFGGIVHSIANDPQQFTPTPGKMTVFVDKPGVGAGTIGKLKELRTEAVGVNTNEASSDSRFARVRSQLAWRVREWVKGGGRLSNDPRWLQLAQVKYKLDSNGKIILQPKDKLIASGVDSPDVYDAFALTFYSPEASYTKKEVDKFFQRKMALKNKRTGRGYALRATKH